MAKRTLSFVALGFLIPVFAYAAQVNINTASVAELDTLPGIGPTKAAAIVEYRTANGPFAAIQDIQNVSGIGPVTFANIEKLITVGDISSLPQPAPQNERYKEVKAVEPINSPERRDTHDVAGRAPAPALKNAGAGAVLPSSAAMEHLFSSPWTFALLGAIIVASGVFIFI